MFSYFMSSPHARLYSCFGSCYYHHYFSLYLLLFLCPSREISPVFLLLQGENLFVNLLSIRGICHLLMKIDNFSQWLSVASAIYPCDTSVFVYFPSPLLHSETFLKRVTSCDNFIFPKRCPTVPG